MSYDAKSTKAESLIYCGPNLPRGVLNQFTVYRGGLPKHLKDHFEKCPAIVSLFVPVDKLSETMIAIGKPGTAQAIWFKRVQEYIKGGAK